jgi:hypothetical protein
MGYDARHNAACSWKNAEQEQHVRSRCIGNAMWRVNRQRLPNLVIWAGAFFAALFLLGLPGDSPAAIAQTSGPGLPNRPFSTDQVYRLLATLDAENGAPQEHSSVVFHKGYVAIVYSEENSQPRAGISFYDFSDPTRPILVAHTEEETGRLSEQHAIAFSHYRGRDLVACWQ